MMEKRIAIMGIVVEEPEIVERLNAILHEYSSIILGRMGIPVREYGLSLISVAICADNDRISALSGKLGRLRGVKAKVTYSNVSVQA